MRIVLIVTGVFVLVGKKLLTAVAFGGLCLVGIGFMMDTVSKPYRRKARINAKTLWLAFRAWRITRELRATSRKMDRIIAEHNRRRGIASTGL